MREITLFVILQQRLKYTLSRTKTIENHWGTFLFIIFSFLSICTNKFGIIETHTYSITHDENAMSS